MGCLAPSPMADGLFVADADESPSGGVYQHQIPPRPLPIDERRRFYQRATVGVPPRSTNGPRSPSFESASRQLKIQLGKVRGGPGIAPGQIPHDSKYRCG